MVKPQRNQTRIFHPDTEGTAELDRIVIAVNPQILPEQVRLLLIMRCSTSREIFQSLTNLVAHGPVRDQPKIDLRNQRRFKPLKLDKTLAEPRERSLQFRHRPPLVDPNSRVFELAIYPSFGVCQLLRPVILGDIDDLFASGD